MKKPKLDLEAEAKAKELRFQQQRACVEALLAAPADSPEQMAWWFDLIGLIAGVIDSTCEKSFVPQPDWPEIAQATLDRLQRNNFRSLRQYLDKRYKREERPSARCPGRPVAANDTFLADDITSVTKVWPVESWVRGACKYEIRTYFAARSKDLCRNSRRADGAEGGDHLASAAGVEAEMSLVQRCNEEVKVQAMRWACEELERRNKAQMLALEMYWAAEEASSAGQRHFDKRQIYQRIDSFFELGGADKADDFVRTARQRLGRIIKTYLKQLSEQYQNDKNYRGPNLFFVDLKIASSGEDP